MLASAIGLLDCAPDAIDPSMGMEADVAHHVTKFSDALAESIAQLWGFTGIHSLNPRPAIAACDALPSMTAYRIDITSVVTMTDDQFYRLSQTGKAFDSSTGFKLPNGANRSLDVAWIRNNRWAALTPEQQQKFSPICPTL